LRREKTITQENSKSKISASNDYAKTLKSTEFWRASLLQDVFNLDISDPRELEQKAKDEVLDEKLKKINHDSPFD
jgi:coenzyme F420-dependent glucose-6-phosphate dehydrogenase